MTEASHLWVIVVSTTDRDRFAKATDLLTRTGTRIRPGVYELLGTRTRIVRLAEELAYCLRSEDQARIYSLCRDCRDRTLLLGGATLSETPVAFIF